MFGCPMPFRLRYIYTVYPSQTAPDDACLYCAAANPFKQFPVPFACTFWNGSYSMKLFDMVYPLWDRYLTNFKIWTERGRDGNWLKPGCYSYKLNEVSLILWYATQRLVGPHSTNRLYQNNRIRLFLFLALGIVLFFALIYRKTTCSFYCFLLF